MKTDARIRYTRMVIKNSFLEILKERPVNRVTVKDVCDMAEINRATFYKHYADCYDLLDKIEDEMILELQQLVQDVQNKDIAVVFNKMFKKIKEDGTIYLTIASNHGDTTFPNRILNMFYEQAYPLFNGQSANSAKEKKEWAYYFLANGCAGVLSHWINNGMKEDTEELSEYISQLINKVVT